MIETARCGGGEVLIDVKTVQRSLQAGQRLPHGEWAR